VVQRILDSILQKGDHEVLVAENGRKALEILAGQPVDLVISDLMMPFMDGWALLGAIRADERLAGLPVFLLTSSSRAQDQQKAADRGADGFFTKPTGSQELLAAVTEATAGREL
jgi:CheY-like chemotaxis protein